jgi:hypothetical protein
VDLRAGLDDLEKRKFLTLPGLGTPTPWSHQKIFKILNVEKHAFFADVRKKY